MTDGQILLLSLVILTLYECTRWVPVRAWVFQGGGAVWKGVRPWTMLRTKGGGGVFLRPLPPFQAHLVAATWPFAPHEKGLCVWDDESGIATHIPWVEVKISLHGAVIVFAGGQRIRCVHAVSARHWANLAVEWKTGTQKDRELSFEKEARALFDEKRLQTAEKELPAETRALRWNGAVIFVWAFVALPLIYFKYGDSLFSVSALGLLLVVMFVQVMLALGSMRKHALLRGTATQHVIGGLLFPPASMRMADWVCGTLSPEVHPLAAINRWSTPSALQEAAKLVWREARWPKGSFDQRPWNGVEVRVLRSMLESWGIPSETLDDAPEKTGEGTHYCPRCHTQYEGDIRICRDCADMPLHSLGC